MGTVDGGDYEDGLRWRLEVLLAKFEAGEMKFTPEVFDQMKASLLAVRTRPDGTIDLDSVDGSVRALAAATAGFHIREKEKDAASLEEVADAYFRFVEENCGFFAQEARRLGLDAHQFAGRVSSSPTAVNEISPQIAGFIEYLSEFWGALTDASHYHLQDIRATKAVYGGDLFPSHARNIASSVGLYIDTIILNDPFWQSRHIFEMASPEMRVYYFVKHSVNVLGYKALATANLDKPIVVVVPHRSPDGDDTDILKLITTRDALNHAAALFGRRFSSAEELNDFGQRLDTIGSVVRECRNPERLLFDTEWTGDIAEQIEKSLNGDWASFGGSSHPGMMVVGQCYGRMGQATDALLKSRYLGGTPLIEAPTSWKYFNWKLEYNSEADANENTHLHMIKGLQHISETDGLWLGKIPPDALIEMRTSGAFEEIRSVLSQGIEEIARAKPQAFFRSSDKIVDNIREAFDRHQKEVRDLRNRNIKFAGADIGSWMIAGGLEVAAAITGTATFGLAALAATQVLDAPTLREIPKKFLGLRNARKELRKSPMGLFFKHHQ
ncbi:hypothetical protein [Shinella sp.]|uniref:hypothetical protein n=1 Tax=Shinella sp. TaxID=1870904 RepID=UPI003C719EE9